MQRLDLTPFGYTPTESLIYATLLTGGAGTGYSIARAAGLARANAYSALEGLVAKGAARVEGARPKRFRPEPPRTLLARIANDHGAALDQLSRELESVAVPDVPAVVEIGSGRSVLQLIGHDVARATKSVVLLLPAEAFPILGPALRRPVAAGLEVSLTAVGHAELPFVDVATIAVPAEWPGAPILSVVDGETGVIATRRGTDVRGHWGTEPAFVAAARLSIDLLKRQAQ